MGPSTIEQEMVAERTTFNNLRRGKTPPAEWELMMVAEDLEFVVVLSCLVMVFFSVGWYWFLCMETYSSSSVLLFLPGFLWSFSLILLVGVVVGVKTSRRGRPLSPPTAFPRPAVASYGALADTGGGHGLGPDVPIPDVPRPDVPTPHHQ